MCKSLLILSVLFSTNLLAMENEQFNGKVSEKFKKELGTILILKSFENIISTTSQEPTEDEILGNLDKLLKKRDELLNKGQISMEEIMNIESALTKKIMCEMRKIYSADQISSVSAKNENQAFYLIKNMWMGMHEMFADFTQEDIERILEDDSSDVFSI